MFPMENSKRCLSIGSTKTDFNVIEISYPKTEKGKGITDFSWKMILPSPIVTIPYFSHFVFARG